MPAALPTCTIIEWISLRIDRKDMPIRIDFICRLWPPLSASGIQITYTIEMTTIAIESCGNLLRHAIIVRHPVRYEDSLSKLQDNNGFLDIK